MNTLLALSLFHLFIFIMLALDLGVFNKKSHKPTLKEALIWSAIWISSGLIFNAGIYYFQGSQKGMEFLTGYLIEKSLSVDNIFVFVLIFSYFSVPSEYQHKVLFWGIIGALFMRAGFILVGTMLIKKFHFILYIFGVFLVYGGYKMMFQSDNEIDPSKNPFLKICRKLFPVTDSYRGSNFFVRENNILKITPLIPVLAVVESTDLIFAIDSIPAIFAITQDAFIVYTSNIFAILGLRSLYFALGDIIEKFTCLKYGLSIVLAFIGIKMLIMDIYKIPTVFSLIVVAVLIFGSVFISFFMNGKAKSARPVVISE